MQAAVATRTGNSAGDEIPVVQQSAGMAGDLLAGLVAMLATWVSLVAAERPLAHSFGRLLH